MTKKLLFIVIPFLLGGCAAGINHSVATIEGKEYLIESKTYNVFGFSQWSKNSYIVLNETELQNNITDSRARAELARIVARCNSNPNIRQSNKSKQDTYNCVLKQLNLGK